MTLHPTPPCGGSTTVHRESSTIRPESSTDRRVDYHPRPGLGSLLLILASAAAVAAIPNTSTSGWRAQTYPKVRGIRSVHLTHQIAHTGRNCLTLAIALDGRVPSQRQGEAYVDLRYSPPADTSFPVNLSGHEITAWLFAPSGLQGPAHNPNGARLFVKDSKWRSEYGPWTHLRPGHWNRLAFTPSAAAPKTGYADAGFDPGKIILVGTSVALGGGSSSRFVGDAFLDDVGWDGKTRYSFEQ